MTDNKIDVHIKQNSGLRSDAEQEQNIQVIGEYNKYGNVYDKLVSIYSSPVTFDPKSLREIIVQIDAGIDSVDSQPIDYSMGIDIDEKNQINNHSNDYFEEFVEVDFYPQFYKLDMFFALKENQKTLQKKVDRVIKSLNRQIIAHQGINKFETVLLEVTSKLIDENYNNLKDKENEILLILYYFYCNCCIGKKTKGEKSVNSK